MDFIDLVNCYVAWLCVGPSGQGDKLLTFN
jgi:hypothetical protein